MQVTVNYPDSIPIGRNGCHGTIDVDWSKVPQDCLDHIVKVYVPQFFSDAANQGGKEATPADRVAIAEKKREALYNGTLRSRTSSDAEPLDPFEAECYRIVIADLMAIFRTSGKLKGLPKGTKDQLMYVVNTERAKVGKGEIDRAELVRLRMADEKVKKSVTRRAKEALEARDLDTDSYMG